MRNNLFEILKLWNARPDVQSSLEGLGFNVHIAYQDEIKRICLQGGEKWESVQKCWNEIAREWISCIGRVDSNRRLFSGDIGYRSSYLDLLSEGKLMRVDPEWCPLHPAECAFAKNINSMPGYGVDITRRAGFIKRQSEDYSIAQEDTKLTLDDLRYKFSEFLAVFGFSQVSKNRSIKEDPCGLVFSAGLDKVDLNFLYQLPFVLEIWSILDKRDKFSITYFDKIVPGFQYAELVSCRSDVMYGLRAYAALFGTLARSLASCTS
jgi:hypothetical protein